MIDLAGPRPLALQIVRLLPSTALLAILATVGFAVLSVPALAAPTPLVNTKAGISLSLSGTNGVDWAVEQTYHDDAIGDMIIYLKSSVSLSLAHNERNSIMYDTAALSHVQGTAGKDGVVNSGDEGDIHYKIDRDQQSHIYAGNRGALPTWCPLYGGSFRFSDLKYDGTKAVLGSVGDNGGAYGSSPLSTTARYCYGQSDAAGNEWHTLTYWDNDIPLYQAANVTSYNRQAASDGHCVSICVNPLTPLIQLSAAAGEQYYTTPLKVYHVPKIWAQTTYLTSGVTLSFVNLTNAEPVMYRVGGTGSFVTWGGGPLSAAALFAPDNTPKLLEVKCGASGAVRQQTFVLNPAVPAAAEQHGYLLWANDAERQTIINKVQNTQPFKTSYTTFKGSWYQGTGQTLDNTRGDWCSGAGQAGTAMNNAFVVALDGPGAAIANARLAKQRLLRLARLQPVGFETTISNSTPGKDYLNELGQTLQTFADAGIAYDLLAAHFRRAQHAEGLTPVEEIRIRDGLAKVASSILFYRNNYSATNGSGDTHWSHGYELAFGTIAMAMPTYATAYYGVSGGDRTTLNTFRDAQNKCWNPFPDQAVTWYQCATDPAISWPGHPNVTYPFRAEFLLTDDGWWSGPNDLVGGPCDASGESDRYVIGPMGSRLVDLHYGNMANAECRVELVEMDGYESPFVERLYTFDFMRRIKGDTARPASVTNYLRRRLTNGIVFLDWNIPTKVYTARAPRVESAIYGFNPHYEFASLPGPMALVGQFLYELNAYYNFGGTIDAATRARLENDRKLLYDARGLAFCYDPATMPAHQPEPNHAPTLKALFKYVVKPGENVSKDIVAGDPDCDPITVTVTGLPSGAAYDSTLRRITWTPGASDAGVRIVTVTASDGRLSVARPFPLIVKADAGSGPVPAGPANLTAALAADNSGVQLNWTNPTGVAIAAVVIYRDGILWATQPPTATSYVDRDMILANSHTRYNISILNTNGAESGAIDATPAIFSVPAGYVAPGSEPLTIEKWEIGANHGPAGEIVTQLSPGYVEPRSSGIAKLLVTFSRAADPATVAPGQVVITSLAHGDCSSAVGATSLINGNTTLVITLSSRLPNADRYTVTLANTVMAADGGPISAERSVQLSALVGDLNGSGNVNLADLLLVRDNLGRPLSAAMATGDTNNSGQLGHEDLLSVRRHLGDALP